jgi:hypothetical protein
MPRLRFSLRTLLVAVTVCALTSPVIPKLMAIYQDWQIARKWEKIGRPGSVAPFTTEIQCEFDRATTSDEVKEERDNS